MARIQGTATKHPQTGAAVCTHRRRGDSWAQTQRLTGGLLRASATAYTHSSSIGSDRAHFQTATVLDGVTIIAPCPTTRLHSPAATAAAQLGVSCSPGWWSLHTCLSPHTIRTCSTVRPVMKAITNSPCRGCRASTHSWKALPPSLLSGLSAPDTCMPGNTYTTAILLSSADGRHEDRADGGVKTPYSAGLAGQCTPAWMHCRCASPAAAA